MKIYIAGQITGLELDVARAAFAEASRLVEGQGHEALDPMRLVEQDERPYNDLLADALRVMLTQADAVYFMPGWRRSKGARIEHFTAGELGMGRFFEIGEIPNA